MASQPTHTFLSFVIRGFSDSRQGWELIRTRILTALIAAVPIGVISAIHVTWQHGYFPRGVIVTLGTCVLAVPALMLWRGYSVAVARRFVVYPYLLVIVVGLLAGGGLGTATSHHLAVWLVVTTMLYGRRGSILAASVSTLLVLLVALWSMSFPFPSELALESHEVLTTARGVIFTGLVTLALMLLYEQQREAHEANLRHVAEHDALTGLPNRVLFVALLEQALKHARREQRLVAVFFADLDDFKRINDLFGHHAGDAMLKATADRLRSTLRATDAIARFGGDEFVGFTELKAPEDFEVVMARIFTALETPIDVGEASVVVDLSLGYSLFPAEGTDPAALLELADKRMYGAKRTTSAEVSSTPRTQLSTEQDAQATLT